MSFSTLEQVDLSDLNLLDDDKAHARCTFCYPGDMTLRRVVALCGATTIQRTTTGDAHVAPPHACEECKKVWWEPCVRCGR